MSHTRKRSKPQAAKRKSPAPLPESILAALTPALTEQQARWIEEEFEPAFSRYVEEKLQPAVEKTALLVRERIDQLNAQIDRLNDQLAERNDRLFEIIRKALEYEHDIARLEIDEDGKDAESALAEAARHIIRRIASEIGCEAGVLAS
jgi:hypothetical protein